jgi:murein DD-endopeptidase MepM/ murein hydrolase activator NlpD
MSNKSVVVFPVKLAKKPTSYQSGVGKFGSRREGGKRVHAGSDIYAPVGTPVIAANSGTIRHISPVFYRNVSAIEINHPTWVGRYCEITLVKGLKEGQQVKAGDVIGYVARIEGIEASMLHFEMYDDQERTDPLTDRTRSGYERRSDLLDPTGFLDAADLAKV